MAGYNQLFCVNILVFQVAITLFEMIEYYESATKIKIGANNKLSQYAWMYLCQMIKKVSSPGVRFENFWFFGECN